MSRKEKIDSLWLKRKSDNKWRLRKEETRKNGKSVFTALPPEGDPRNLWAAVWEYIPYMYTDTNEITYYVLYPNWFEEEFTK